MLVTHRPRAQRIDGPPEVRFWPKVDRTGGPDACWPWLAQLSSGYGRFVAEAGRNVPAHRWAYEQVHGAVAPGADLDHACHNRACVRPDPAHVYATTPKLNRGWYHASKTHCPQGHPYDDANTYRTPSGRRLCRACRRAPRTGQTGSYWAAKTHCPAGHPYNDENTYLYQGRRYCRACKMSRSTRTRVTADGHAVKRWVRKPPAQPIATV